MWELVSRYSEWGLKVIGYVERNGESPRGEGLGTVSDIPRIVESNVVDEIIFVGNGPKDLDGLEETLALCKEEGICTRLAADFFPAKVSRVSMEFLENIPVLTFSTTPDHPASLFIKRAMDVTISAALLLLLSPFMLIVALWIKLTSKGPIIYDQVRCGLYGRKC